MELATTARLRAKVPSGRLQEKWDTYKNACKLVNPANKRKHTILIVGTGLAGGAAAATLGGLAQRLEGWAPNRFLALLDLVSAATTDGRRRRPAHPPARSRSRSPWQ